MTSWAETAHQVRERAGDRCEYCGMHQSLQGATFHVEHIRPRRWGGGDSLDNLAWACPGCNLAKADRIEGPDPQTGLSVPLFHPRTDVWSHHFRWNGLDVIALTPAGRATIALLDLNRQRRVLIRKAEQGFGLFPPPVS